MLRLDRTDLVDTQVICNLSVGACNPTVIADIISRGAQVRELGALHAKVYIGAYAAVVGSANASSGGLGAGAAKTWEEACVKLDAPEELAELNRWFELQWEAAKDMSEPAVADLLLNRAKRDQAIANQKAVPIDLLETLRVNPSALKNRSVHVSLDWERYLTPVTNQVRRFKKIVGKNVDAWENWPQMPKSADIIAFYDNGSHEGVQFEGIYQGPADPRAVMDPKTKAILVLKTLRILGIYSLGDVAQWIAAVERYKQDVYVSGPRPKGKNAVMHVCTFAERYLFPTATRADKPARRRL